VEAAARFPDPSAAVNVTELITAAIEGALDERASDIHFDPQDDALVQRMRVDGVMQEVQRIPKPLGHSLTSRLKSMATLVAAERRMPQTGSIAVLVRGEQHHLRCTVIPTVHGEHVALRFVPAAERPQPLPELGLAADAEETLAFALARTSGLVLVVGPPGSGKTTTAYAVLARLNTPTRILMTLEDPVERTLPGVDHIAVNGAGSPTFAQAQRAVLRAAPHVLLIGEIRDQETARAAVEAALSGVLVIATMLATDAASSIARIAELGVERDLIANAVRCVVAQRLVRTLCTQCREHYVADEDVRALVGGSSGDAVPLQLYRSRGCRQCLQTGFVGRAAVFEVMSVDEDRRDVVRTGTTDEIATAAAGVQAMPPLGRNAMQLVRSGATSLDEALAAVSDLTG
jgi:type II secretory ATPase GspE/PulE/Tfp pilus assembly ATPase PilB-like protein